MQRKVGQGQRFVRMNELTFAANFWAALFAATAAGGDRGAAKGSGAIDQEVRRTLGANQRSFRLPEHKSFVLFYFFYLCFYFL